MIWDSKIHKLPDFRRINTGDDDELTKLAVIAKETGYSVDSIKKQLSAAIRKLWLTPSSFAEIRKLTERERYDRNPVSGWDKVKRKRKLNNATTATKS